MISREIPKGSIEIQKGLWLHETQQTIGNNTYTWRNLYAANGYCFYDLTDKYYDQEGNEISESEVLATQRVYYQFMSIPKNKDIKDLVSVAKDNNYNVI